VTNKELFYFTGRCLSLDDIPAARMIIKDKISGEEIDWERFVRLCSNHLILQVIYLKFWSHGLLNYLPPDLAGHLENIYQLNCNRNDQILKQIGEITTELNKANIYPVFLKGAANLLDCVYNDVGERIIGDIDLLVPEKDYLTSAEIIQGMGYAKDDWPVYIDVLSAKHYPRLWKKDVPADVEIHRLVSEKYFHQLNPEMIFKDKKSLPQHPGVFVPSDEHMVLHNFIHSQLANSEHYYGIVSLRNLYDLYLFSKRIELLPLFHSRNLRNISIDYFTLAVKILDLPGRFVPKGNIYSTLHTMWHDLRLTSVSYYKTDRFVHKIIHMIYNSYLKKFIISIYSRSMRRQVLGRLKDPKWYGIHFKRYKDLLE
jgi:hypothetical protein